VTEPILLVDNDLSLAQAITNVLEPHGIPVEHCSSTHGAIELLQAKSYPLVIIDVVLGDDSASGIYIIDAIRRLPRAERPTVLMISGSGVEKLRGVDRKVVAAVLLKPLDFELFAKQVVATYRHVAPEAPPAPVESARLPVRVARTFCGSCGTEIPPWAAEVPAVAAEVLDREETFRVWLEMPCRSCGRAPREAGGRSEL